MLGIDVFWQSTSIVALRTNCLHEQHVGLSPCPSNNRKNKTVPCCYPCLKMSRHSAPEGKQSSRWTRRHSTLVMGLEPKRSNPSPSLGKFEKYFACLQRLRWGLRCAKVPIWIWKISYSARAEPSLRKWRKKWKALKILCLAWFSLHASLFRIALASIYHCYRLHLTEPKYKNSLSQGVETVFDSSEQLCTRYAWTQQWSRWLQEWCTPTLLFTVCLELVHAHITLQCNIRQHFPDCRLCSIEIACHDPGLWCPHFSHRSVPIWWSRRSWRWQRWQRWRRWWCWRGRRWTWHSNNSWDAFLANGDLLKSAKLGRELGFGRWRRRSTATRNWCLLWSTKSRYLILQTVSYAHTYLAIVLYHPAPSQVSTEKLTSSNSLLTWSGYWISPVMSISVVTLSKRQHYRINSNVRSRTHASGGNEWFCIQKPQVLPFTKPSLWLTTCIIHPDQIVHDIHVVAIRQVAT